jgi:hypothetical protein
MPEGLRLAGVIQYTLIMLVLMPFGGGWMVSRHAIRATDSRPHSSRSRVQRLDRRHITRGGGDLLDRLPVKLRPVRLSRRLVGAYADPLHAENRDRARPVHVVPVGPLGRRRCHFADPAA